VSAWRAASASSKLLQRGGQAAITIANNAAETSTPDDVDDLDEAPDSEVEAAEEEILDQATAASVSIVELKRIEIETLKSLEGLALQAVQAQRRRHEVARAREPAAERSLP
jgi:hypothetical protein